MTQVENRDGQRALLSSYAYTYNLSGNQVSKTDHTGRSTAYTYDGAGRLTNETETLSGQTVFSAAYSYDLRGNRAQMTVGGTESYTVTYAYDLNNRLLSETKAAAAGDTLTEYRYDANGNTLSASTGTGAELYTYDAFSRMTVVENGEGSHTYAYCPDGLRQSKTVGGVTTTHIWDGQSIAAELEGGTLKTTYIRGINLLAREDNAGARRYYLYNAHGDVTQLTDHAGGLAWAYDYDAFGNQRALTGYAGADSNPFRYCGEYLDFETGTYYLRARYYDPTIGRFLAEDTYIGSPKDPLSLNFYTYANNNPILYKDSSGNFAILASIGAVVIGAAVGGVINLGGQLISNGGTFKNVNWRSVRASAAAGAVTTGMAIMTGGASLTVQSAMVGGALIAGAGYSTYHLVNGSKATLDGYLTSMAFGAFTAGTISKLTGGNAIGSSSINASGETTKIYRVVSEAEYKSITSNGGKFSSTNGAMEAKWFATSQKDAAQWGKQNYLNRNSEKFFKSILLSVESRQY